MMRGLLLWIASKQIFKMGVNDTVLIILTSVMNLRALFTKKYKFSMVYAILQTASEEV
jgi:hypothetical protein